MEDEDPPTETFTYTSSFTFYTQTIPIDKDMELYISMVLPCHPKAKRLDPGKGYEWMLNYVYKKLHASGVFYEDQINPANPFGITRNITSQALKCGDTDWGYGFGCIDAANFLVELAIEHPPPAIDEKHFSLQAFAKNTARVTKT